MHSDRVLSIKLWGYPTFQWDDGIKINITSKKSIALLALLATAPDFLRSRVWLQQKLWGSRDQHQAQNSLRRELSSLRKLLNRDGVAVLKADHRAVRLHNAHIVVDTGVAHEPATEEFLEGLDIPGAEDFEEWLREMRSHYSEKFQDAGDTSRDIDRATAQNNLNKNEMAGSLAASDGSVDWLGETSKIVEAIALDPRVSLGYPDNAYVYKEGFGKRYVYESGGDEKYILSAELYADNGTEKYQLELKSLTGYVVFQVEKKLDQKDWFISNRSLPTSVLVKILELINGGLFY